MRTRFDIFPGQGVVEIAFGSSPVAVRAAVGSEYELFRRSPDEAFPSDYFRALGTFAYYDPPGRLAALEFGRPSAPHLNGTDLLAIPFSDARQILRSLDPAAVEDRTSIISKKVGAGLYAPTAKEDASQPCESVIVFSDGYYD